jgi:hypothetical protein
MATKVPTKITRDMRQQLLNLGLKRDEIKNLTPQQAWDFIVSANKPDKPVTPEAIANGLEDWLGQHKGEKGGFITDPEAGSYYITTSQSTCVSGSNQYATTRILINGSQVAYGVSDPYECASAAASVFKKLSAGDVISGQCSHNGGSQTSCAMTIVQISSTNTTTGSGTGLGVAQAYVDVTASRAINTNYTNSTGKPIFVIISTVNSNSVSSLWATVDGIMLGYTGCMNGRRCQTSFVVPNGSTYSASWNGSNTLANWVELR